MKYFDVADENRDLIDEIFQKTGLHNYVNLIILGSPKPLDKYKVIKVGKNNPIGEKLGNCPESVICYLYEEGFDRLDAETKEMLVTDAITVISYDTEKDKIVLGCPTITVTLGGRAHFGEALLNAKETAVHVIAQIEEEKKERAEQIKAVRKMKQNK